MMSKSTLVKRLIKGTLWSFVGTVISRGMMLLASIFVARFLGKIGYGEFGMIRSTVGMLGIYAGFGMGLTATKFVAELKDSDPERVGRIVGLTWQCALIASGILVLVLLFFAEWIADAALHAPDLANALRIGSLVLFINAINGIQTGALAGFEAFKEIAKVNLWVGLCSFPILVAGAYLGGVNGAIVGLVINLGIHWVLNHLQLRKQFHKHNIKPSFGNWKKELKVLGTYSVPAVVSGTMVAPVLWFGKSLLAVQPDGYGELGIFTLAETWRTLVVVGCGMIGQASFPVLAQLYGEGKRQAFKKTLAAQMGLTGFIVCSFTLVFVVCSGLIEDAYGEEFQNSVPVVILVLVSAIPMQLTTVGGFVNRCVGNIWWGVLLNGIWGVSYIVATSCLIHQGAVGLAWATIISYVIHFFTTGIYIFWIFRTSDKLRSIPEPSSNLRHSSAP